MANYNGKSIPTDGSKNIITWSEEQKNDLNTSFNDLSNLIRIERQTENIGGGGNVFPFTRAGYTLINVYSTTRVQIVNLWYQESHSRFVATFRNEDGTVVSQGEAVSFYNVFIKNDYRVNI